MILEGIQQAGTGSNNASQGTVTSPTSLAKDDLILVFLNLRGGMSSNDITTPDGYLLKPGGQVHGAGSWHANVNVYYKIAEQSDADATDITLQWTSDRRWRLATGRIAAGDFDSNDIFGNTISDDDATNVSAFSLSSINVTEGNLVIGCFGVSDLDQNQQSTDDPAIFADEHVNIDAGSTAGIVLNLSSYTPGSDGTTGTAQWTWTNTGNPAATIFEINVADDFGITSPLHQATGVPVPVDIDISNPNTAQGFYIEGSKDAPDGNGDLSNLVVDFVTTSTSTEISGLDAATTHYLKAIEILTLGGQSSEAVFSDDFNRADGAGWGADYDSEVNSGTASNFIENNTGVIEIDPLSRLLIKVLGPSVENFDKTWEIENENVSTDYQPTLHFSVQGDWNDDGKIHSYWVYLNGDEFTLGRTSASYSNKEFKTETFARTADVKYVIRVLKIGFWIRVAIWPKSGSQDGWTIDYTDTSEISSEGTVALVVATTAGSVADERMTFTLIEYSLASEAPQITNIDTTEDSASITFSTVPFDNEGYEYQYRESGGSFGSWVNIAYVSPFELSLALGDYEIQMSALHNGERSPISDIVEFTIAEAGVSNMVISPSSPTLSEETASTETLTRTLDSTGGASKATTWSITQQPSNGSISIKSQSDSQCVIEAGSGLVVGNSWQVKATSDFNNQVFATVTGTITEGLDLDITDTADADKQTLADFYSETGADWEDEKTHFDPGGDPGGSGPDFYTHTGNSTGWSTNPDNIDLSPGNEPFGIETELIGGEYRVISLKLNSTSDVGWVQEYRVSEDGTKGGNNITGFITPDFNWQLYRCRYISLKHNYINFQIPRKIFTPHLEILNLNGTYSEEAPGRLPGISNKANWVQRSMRLNGSIPAEIGFATSLEVLMARGRHWGDQDENTTSSNNVHVDQYALGGDIPNEIMNSGIALFDTLSQKFTGFPADFPDNLQIIRMSDSIRIPDTDPIERYMEGLGVSKLSFLENRPNLVRVNMGNLYLGEGTSDTGPFPNLSASTSLIDFFIGNNGITGTPGSWICDGTIDGLVGGGIASFVASNNNIQGPLPDGGFDYGFGHRFARATLRLSNCGIGGEFPESWMDPGTIQFSIGGNQFTNNMDVMSAGWGSLQRIRNIELNNNNFTGGLPIGIDWYSHVRQTTTHGLSKWSRIRVDNSGLSLTATQPKKPWEISQKQRRWYYDNKNNIIDNVDSSYTLGDALSDGYSESFIDATLGTSSWSNGDSAFTFFTNILNGIYNGWLVKDF